MAPNRALFKFNRPVGVVEERFPALVLPVGQLEAEGGAGPGLDRRLDQAHARLGRGPPPLPDVALDAGADDVLPVGAAPAAPGHHVVEAQLAGREPPAAVLAAVAVAGEDVPPIELDPGPGEPVVGQEPDHAGDLDLEVDGPDEIVVGVLEPGPGLGDGSPAVEV